ncbi:ribosome biogenesis protein URB2 CYBJADRAFT_167739 [Cyberlindnera jadinii NRRL Y-1542]|uniref:Nucleolar 27S pre-rRNA processing Urb2/Npa2 C-terminal domain-containing protein n=1 Tax=Cyberlindnera jadinii (strain ATCC 18201 / CBS 1600 / BCRC 20928 / JCM 3617 / NBRC 0987 / NRRL Y-1542) TaxID=983966 RepID=A0A1E4S2K9_CYBJN|nr:hypothetical protein CYBJADRAFT_167739 [Cyberlindnera jadinii NRRL Y-1542]ODV73731.1 hypothetical protein CYBJADRAFT_167739 [Cyberlindnera jadinii NRRL Y-1542]
MSLSLTTAEGVTKYLRSKTTTVEEIVKVSNQLLDDELAVYLPNAVKFVFELLVDRLNGKTAFRCEGSVWTLFNKTWRMLNTESKFRNRTFQRLRFGEVFSTGVAGIVPSAESCETVTETLYLVRSESSLFNSQDHAVQILGNYLTLLDKVEGVNYEQSIKEVVLFFKSAVSVEKYSEKFINLFVINALPIILDFIHSKESSSPLVPLLKRIILSNQNLDHLEQNIDLLLKQEVSPNGMAQMYTLVVDCLSKNDTEKMQKIFTKIVQQYPTLSGNLLECILNTKRTLSHDFLLNIFERELANSEQNWDLVKAVFKLDIEIVTQQAERIMKLLDNSSNKYCDEDYLSVGTEIVNAYIRARDLESFFKIWTSLLTAKSIWSSNEFRDVVSRSVLSLSSTQLKSIITTLLNMDSDSKFISLATLTQGLFSVKDKIVLNDAREILKHVFDIEIDYAWEVKYYLLCLFEDIVPMMELKKIANGKLKVSSEYQFHTLFRIRELTDFNTEQLASLFVKFVKSNPSSNILEMTFERWSVLINEILETEQMGQLVDELLSKQELTLIALRNPQIYECLTIIETIVSKITKRIQSSKELTSFDSIVLEQIPIQCYPKSTKIPLLNALSRKCLSSKQEEHLVPILHILQTPTFKSDIESDVSLIDKMVQTFPDSSFFNTIWKQRYANLKDDENLTFMKTLMNYVSERLTNVKDVSSIMHIAFVMLSNAPDQLDLSHLQSQFIECSKDILTCQLKETSFDETHDISWILQALYKLDVDASNFDKLYTLLLSFGESIQASNHVEAKRNLFLVLVKYRKLGSSFEFFESLYIILREQGIQRDDMIGGLAYLLKSLDADSFNNSLENAINSKATDYVIEVVTCHWGFLQRSNNKSQELFVKSLSSFASNITNIASGSLEGILISLKSLLVEKSWVFSQYAVELVFVFLSRAVDHLDLSSSKSEDCFTLITLCASNILLFHRHRLTNRHHIVISLFNSLLKSLTRRSSPSVLQSSVTAAESYQRLLSNLCEPTQSKSSSDDSLTSTLDIKKSVRKHIYILLLTYINLSLKFTFEASVREALLPGIFGIFDLVSNDELLLVSTSLDYSGRSYYKTLYEEYKKVGKWQAD